MNRIIDTRPHDPANGVAELSTEEARQGETSGHVRIILAVSLTLALIVMAGMLSGVMSNWFS